MASAPALGDDRAQLLAVNRLGHDGATVADEPGDLLDRDRGVREQADEAVAQLSSPARLAVRRLAPPFRVSGMDEDPRSRSSMNR